MTSPNSTTSGHNVELTETGVWMNYVDYEDLVLRANAKTTRISWPECVFAIFVMFFILSAIGILTR